MANGIPLKGTWYFEKPNTNSSKLVFDFSTTVGNIKMV